MTGHSEGSTPGPAGPSRGPQWAAKTALRDQLLTTRGRRPLAEVGEDARVMAGHLMEWEPVRRAATVAAYVSVGREPGTGLLLDALVEAGKRVVLPVLQPDNDLDWAPYDGPDSLAPARLGLLEPVTPRLGPGAVATADVLLVPGLAVSAAGERLGRGGGCYDRVLARVPVGTPIAVLLHEEEVGVAVPTEPHDRRVTHAATASGVRPLGLPA